MDQNVLLKVDKLRNAYISAIKKLGVPALVEYFQPFWDAGCLALGWTQYTPYFNDGAPCEFGLNDLCVGAPETEDPSQYVYFHGTAPDGTPFDFLESSSGPYSHCFTELDKGSCKYPWSWASSVVEDLCKQLFGDHVLICLFPDGTYTVTEYDHD